MHYENCDKTPVIDQPFQMNENAIEAIVERILNNQRDARVHIPLNRNGNDQPEEKQETKVTDFADSLDDIDEGLINSMLDAVEMLKRK